MVLAKVRSHPQKRENPPSFDEGFPMIVNLAGDENRTNTLRAQHQHLMDRYRLRPAFAMIALELIYGGARP